MRHVRVISMLLILSQVQIMPVSSQLEPMAIVSILTTSISLVKYIASLWTGTFQDRKDGDDNLTFGPTIPGLGFGIPGPLPDLGLDLDMINQSLKGNSSHWNVLLDKKNIEQNVLAHFSAMSAKLNGLDTRLGAVENSLARLVQQLPALLKWELGEDRLFQLMRPIHSLYDTFRLYQEQKDLIERLTLEDFATTVVSHGTDSIRSLLWQLHDITVPNPVSSALRSIPETETSRSKVRGDNLSPQSRPVEPDTPSRKRRLLRSGILDQFLEYYKASDNLICSTNKSPHQMVYDLYTLLALTDAKGYAMMQFSWILLRLYGKGNFTLESEIARADFERRVTEKAQTARRALASLSTWMWRCDASQTEQKEGDAFLRFTEVLQGYIINEVDLNPYNTCKESCSSYTSGQEVSCYANQFCSKQKTCRAGKVYNCGFIEADSSVCSSNEPGRRYDWIEYKSGRLLGRKSDCNMKGQNMTRADSWWRWLFWHCSYCVCLCDQPSSSSDRYVSLQTVVSDASKNFLVTGLRLVKSGRVVHLQIQEGVAMPRGTVNGSSLHWKTVDPISIPMDSESDQDGPNYATLRYDQRALDLDDIQVPAGHVVTGVRFRKLGGHLNLEVQASPINFVTGEITPSGAIWLSNDNTPASDTPRTKLNLVSPDVPTRSKSSSLPDSKTDQYVEFQASSLEKDVSQTTVPFLDAQPVVPQPPIWLTGVGIYHKGQLGYGGYVALRVSTLNVSDYLLVPNGNFNFTSGNEA